MPWMYIVGIILNYAASTLTGLGEDAPFIDRGLPADEGRLPCLLLVWWGVCPIPLKQQNIINFCVPLQAFPIYKIKKEYVTCS